MKIGLRSATRLLMTCLVLAASGSAAAQAPALPDKPGGWVKIDNLQPVTGVDGKEHQPTCSGFPGTDPSFSFWARRGTTNNVVVYFEGGGACWDNLTCSFPIASGLPPQLPQFFIPAVVIDPAQHDGIFNFEPSDNPVKHWSFVYIPYCTGDLHLGSSRKTYANAGNPLLPVPQFTIDHRGFDNFMVVLDWMQRNFKAPRRILVAGSSAGGYGASGNFPWIVETYRNAHVHVMADGSQGVTTPAFDVGNPGRDSWNLMLPPWIFGVDPSWVRSSDLLRYAVEYYPHVKASQFTTGFDEVQIPFYGLMTRFYGPGGTCPNPAIDWNRQMLASLAAYVGAVDNYRYYLAGGSYHTILRSPRLYQEASGGIVFSEWLFGKLRSQGGTGGEGGVPWRNSACPTCLTPAPCS